MLYEEVVGKALVKRSVAGAIALYSGSARNAFSLSVIKETGATTRHIFETQYYSLRLCCDPV